MRAVEFLFFLEIKSKDTQNLKMLRLKRASFLGLQSLFQYRAGSNTGLLFIAGRARLSMEKINRALCAVK